MRKSTIFAVAASIATLAATAPVTAAEIKVLVGGAMTEPMREVAVDFSKRTGHSVEFVSDTTGAIQRRLRAGETADIIVLSGAGMDATEKENFIAPGSRIDLSRALIGVGVRANSAAVPDLSSPDAFKQTLLAVSSISYVSPEAGGTSGVYFDGLIDRMGIGDQVRAKTVYATQGSEVAANVAEGRAEIGITFTSELMPNKGVKVAGTLPEAIQLPTNYVAALAASAASADAARAFIRAMQTPEGSAAIRAGGMEPLNEIH